MNEFSGKLPAPLKKNTAVSRKVLNVNKKLNKQRTRTCHALRWPSPASSRACSDSSARNFMDEEL